MRVSTKKKRWERLKERVEKVKARLEIDGVIVDCWTLLLSWFLRVVVWACWLLSWAFQYLSHFGSGPNLATCILSTLLFFPTPTALVFFLIFIFLFFYLFSVILLWLYSIEHPVSWLSLFFSVQSSLQTVRHHAEQWTGKDQEEGGGRRVQPAGVKGQSAAG